jgi:hypothetical protein
VESTLEETDEPVERTVDWCIEVWPIELMDALEGLGDDNGDKLPPQSSPSLRRSHGQVG